MSIELRPYQQALVEEIRKKFTPEPPNPYACHNKPRPVDGAVTHRGQDGWRDTIDHDNVMPTRIPVMVDIRHTMSTDCRYDASTTDARCAGCEHVKAPAPAPALDAYDSAMAVIDAGRRQRLERRLAVQSVGIDRRTGADRRGDN